MSNADQRQIKRIKLLEFIANKAEFLPNMEIYRDDVYEYFHAEEDNEIQNIDGIIMYLAQKGYLKITPVSSSQSLDSFMTAKITSKGIDLIERIEQNRDTTEFENDFSKQVLNNYTINIHSMTHSQVQQATQNSNQHFKISDTNRDELLNILEKLKATEPESSNIIKPIEEELKKPKIDWSKINPYIQTLLATSAIATQLFTSEFRILLGLK
ncbi:MAG: hypothetical protein KA146_05355 [Leptospiraceae bacterium]|nr:hypothetical protein [Leptospiraceae bacterium]